MEEQKRDIIRFVQDQKAHGYSITRNLTGYGRKKVNLLFLVYAG